MSGFAWLSQSPCTEPTVHAVSGVRVWGGHLAPTETHWLAFKSIKLPKLVVNRHEGNKMKTSFTLVLICCSFLALFRCSFIFEQEVRIQHVHFPADTLRLALLSKEELQECHVCNRET